MAKKKREPNKPDSQELTPWPEPQKQQEDGLALLKSIADSNKATADMLQAINRRMDDQDHKIAAVAKQAAEEPPKPNIMQQAMTLLSGDSPIGKLLSTLIDSFAKMPQEAPIKQGSMDEDLFAAYKDSMKATWKANSDMIAENVKGMKLDNELKSKRLTEEF
jgi:hypothetical protein